MPGGSVSLINTTGRIKKEWGQERWQIFDEGSFAIVGHSDAKGSEAKAAYEVIRTGSLNPGQ